MRNLIWMVLILGGCAGDSGKKAKKEAYSYDFTENGCKTNAQSSGSIEGICRKLQDDALNNYCAYGMRAAEYNRYNCFALLGNRPSLDAE